MYEAFQPVSIAEKLPLKVESLLAHGDRLLVGTFTGVLLVYEIREPHGDLPLSVNLLDSKKNFSKKPIEQMDVIKEGDMLLSLSDGHIRIHNLKTFVLRDNLARTRGANVFAVDTNIATGPGGVPMIETRLAVAVKKRLLIFTWNDTDFVDIKEYPLPDRVRTISWARLDRICLGYGRDYGVMALPSGTVTELFSPSTIPMNLNPLSTLSTMGMGIATGVGAKTVKPLVLKIPNEELLILKDSVSVFTDANGSPRPKPAISWSSIPEELSFSFPYALALLPKHIEIRNIGSQALVQSIEMNQPPKIATQGKFIYIAGGSQIWRLLAHPFPEQIQQLVSRHEFEEAIGLFNQVEPLPNAEKVGELFRIKKLHAHHLFVSRNYDRAMTLFSELDTNPVEVVQLFPEPISGRQRRPGEGHWDGEKGKETESDSGSVPTGTELDEAVGALIRFLTEKRALIARTLTTFQKRAQSVSNSASSLSDITKDSNAHKYPASDATAYLTPDEHRLLSTAVEQAQIVDTALLRAYLNTNDALVGPLLRVQNHCRVEECESILLQKKKYRELLDLYYGKGLHRKSLQLMSNLGQAQGGELTGTATKLAGPEPTINYLQRLGAEHFDMILEFSPWVLKKYPDSGMRIFIDDYSSIEDLPRDKVVSFLERVEPDGSLAKRYIEHVVCEWRDETPEFHQRLIELYLATLDNERGKNSSKDATENSESEVRKKLLRHLENLAHYKPERVLSLLPLEGMYEERAILLGRLGQHEQALQIYVHKLGSNQQAEEYCRKYRSSSEEVYLALLKVFLQPPSDKPIKLEQALALLTKYGSDISASEVLQLMPPTVKMDRMMGYFTKYVRQANKNQRMTAVVKHLWQAEQLQIQTQLIYYRSRRVKITEDRMCPRCNKRISNSVFAVLPTGIVVHYSCATSANEQSRGSPLNLFSSTTVGSAI